jgi:hypothetical protein
VDPSGVEPADEGGDEEEVGLLLLLSTCMAVAARIAAIVPADLLLTVEKLFILRLLFLSVALTL